MDPQTFIGVDVSKTWLEFAIAVKGSSFILRFKFDNNNAGFRNLVTALRTNRVVIGGKVLVTIENGSYGDSFINFMHKKKCLICVESALRIKKSLGLQRGKNDSIDAERILDYSMKNKEKLFLWKAPRKLIIQLKDLLTNRERAIRLLNALEVPLAELKAKYKRHDWLKIKRLNTGGIDGLQETIKKIDTEIQSIAKSDKEISRQMTLLTSVPGIGKIIALHLICRTNEFSMYKTGKTLACLAGVAPFEYSSGTLAGKGHVSSYHNKILKQYLHMGAVSSLRSKTSELRKYYDRKVAEGKHKMLVINNLRNKILLRAAAVIRKGEPYKPLP